MRDRVAAGLPRLLDGQLADQRAPERGKKRIAATVERVRLDRGKHVIVRELMSRVDDQAVEGPEAKRLLLDDLEVLPRLAEIDGEGDDLRGVLVLDPLEHHGGVETTGIEEQHATDLLRTGLIGGRHRSGRSAAIRPRNAEGRRRAHHRPVVLRAG